MHADQGGGRRGTEQDSVGALRAGLTPAPPAAPAAAPAPPAPPQVGYLLHSLQAGRDVHLRRGRPLLLGPRPRDRADPKEEEADDNRVHGQRLKVLLRTGR